MKKISVLMTVYNASKMLDKSISGILKQTYTNYEFIIINDGSADESSKIIKKYAEKDKRIIFVDRKENKGRMYSLNEGLSLCSGEWIAINDADDVSDIHRFEKIVNFIEKNNIENKFGIVGSASRTKDIVREKQKNNYIKYGRIGKKRVARFRAFYSMPFIHSTFVYNAKVLHEIGGFPKEVTSLIDLFAVVKISNTYPIYGLNEILVDRYVDGNNFFMKEEMKSQAQRNTEIINNWKKENYKGYLFCRCMGILVDTLKRRKS